MSTVGVTDRYKRTDVWVQGSHTRVVIDANRCETACPALGHKRGCYDLPNNGNYVCAGLLGWKNDDYGSSEM